MIYLIYDLQGRKEGRIVWKKLTDLRGKEGWM